MAVSHMRKRSDVRRSICVSSSMLGGGQSGGGAINTFSRREGSLSRKGPPAPVVENEPENVLRDKPQGPIGFDTDEQIMFATRLAQRRKTGHQNKRRLISTFIVTHASEKDGAKLPQAWQQKWK